MREVRGRSIVCIVLLLMALAPSTLSARSKDKNKRDKRAARIEFSGFMENYDDLKRVDGFSDFVWGYTKRPLVLADYSEAVIDPILVYLQPGDAGGVGLDPEKLAELTTFFRSSVIEQLEKVRDFEVVDEPGPGVMRVRIAITDIDLSHSGANVGTRVAAVATVGAGFLVPAVDVGGATMECEILDSESGERLVAVVDIDRGRRMFNFRSMTTLGDAKAAMREWAKEFRTNLQRIHEGRLPSKLEPSRERD